MFCFLQINYHQLSSLLYSLNRKTTTWINLQRRTKTDREICYPEIKISAVLLVILTFGIPVYTGKQSVEKFDEKNFKLHPRVK